MFCCGPQPLHLNRIAVSFDNNLTSHVPQKIGDLIKKRKDQVMLPRQVLVNKNGKFLYYGAQQLQQADYLLSLSEENRMLCIEQLKQTPSHELWVNLISEQAELTEGSMFSFEFPRFEVYRLPSFLSDKSQKSDKQINTQYSCRICFGKQTSKKNPLLIPCKCTGSIKYVHLQCQQQWLKEGAHVTEGQDFQYYNFTKVKCNVCKQLWHQKMTHNKIVYYLFDFDESDFRKRIPNEQQQQGRETIRIITLLMRTQAQDQQSSVGIIQIKLQNKNGNGKQFSFGSDQEANLIIELISSKIQASLYFKNNKLYLKDKDSLLGTSLRVKDLTKNFSFSSKKGLIMKHDFELYQICKKAKVFQCFSSNENYKLVFKQFSNSAIQKRSSSVQGQQTAKKTGQLAQFGPTRRQLIRNNVVDMHEPFNPMMLFQFLQQITLISDSSVQEQSLNILNRNVIE